MRYEVCFVDEVFQNDTLYEVFDNLEDAQECCEWLNDDGAYAWINGYNSDEIFRILG